MRKDVTTMVCPAKLAGGLDNPLRRLLQNPRKIVAPYIRPGMTVLDLGCGPGFFSMEIAKLLAGSGKVIAADLQEEMLERVRAKVRDTALEAVLETHRCGADRIGLEELVDFAFAFYMVHEVRDHDALFAELRSLLKPDGRLLVMEPKFHVTGKAFDAMEARLIGAGFAIIERPAITMSRAILATPEK